MKLKAILFLICAASALTAGSARADLAYDVSGTFDSSTAFTSLSGASDIFDLKFTLAQSPTPSTSFPGYFTVAPTNLTYFLDGSPVPVSADNLAFYTQANGGLLSVDVSTATDSAELVFSGNQLFSGTTASPVLTTGEFLANASSFAIVNGVPMTLHDGSVAAVPEPSAVALVLIGLVFWAGISFIKKPLGAVEP